MGESRRRSPKADALLSQEMDRAARRASSAAEAGNVASEATADGGPSGAAGSGAARAASPRGACSSTGARGDAVARDRSLPPPSGEPRSPPGGGVPRADRRADAAPGGGGARSSPGPSPSLRRRGGVADGFGDRAELRRRVRERGAASESPEPGPAAAGRAAAEWRRFALRADRAVSDVARAEKRRRTAGGSAGDRAVAKMDRGLRVASRAPPDGGDASSAPSPKASRPGSAGGALFCASRGSDSSKDELRLAPSSPRRPAAGGDPSRDRKGGSAWPSTTSRQRPTAP